MADFTQGISIDGIEYMVPFVSIKREAPFLDKAADRTEDGDLYRELIGVYYNYTMSFGTIDDVDLYIKLYEHLTQPVPYHTFTLPTSRGTYSFVGYISSVTDEMEKILEDTVKFKALTCKFTAKSPARKPV